jgi:hydrogenase nickel incorporation protein HypA/HybF
MHEWALAEAVIASAAEVAKNEKLRQVTEVTVKIGELQQVEREILVFALKQLKPIGFNSTRFQVTKGKTKLKCRACGNTWLFRRSKLDAETAEAIHFVPEVAHTYIRCSRCGSPDFEIAEGRGLWLENVKGVR